MSLPPRRIVGWRHGRTSWNVAGRFQGQTDVPLDDLGHQQARDAARRLASLHPAALVSSDLSRAVDTAGELARLTGLPVVLDKALREADYGSWEGLTLDEVAAQYPDDLRAWRAFEPIRRGGGESEPEVGARIREAMLGHVAALPPGATLVVTSHGSALRSGLGAMVGLEARCWKALGPLANCQWSVLVESPAGWRLAEHNAGSLPEPVLSDDE